MTTSMWLLLGWTFLMLGFGWCWGTLYERSRNEDQDQDQEPEEQEPAPEEERYWEPDWDREDRDADEEYARMLASEARRRRVYTPPPPGYVRARRRTAVYPGAPTVTYAYGFSRLPDARPAARSGPLPPVWPPPAPAWQERPDWAITTDVITRIIDWDAYAPT